MREVTLGFALTVAVLVSCSQDKDPPLSASGVRIYAPLAGQPMSVAYMTLHNNSNGLLLISGASSPSFAKVEMHETLVTDGIARMRKLDSLGIAAGASSEFAAGGRHFMLLSPEGNVQTGDQVTLKLHYDNGAVLVLQAPVLDRSTP